LKLAAQHLYAWSLYYCKFHIWIQGSSSCPDRYRHATICLGVWS
jgi:hypothetical protein